MPKINLLIPAFFIFLLSGCSSYKETPVTKEEAIQLSAVISSSIKNKKGTQFNELLSPDVFANRINAQTEKKGKIDRDLLVGVQSALKKNNMGNQIIQATEKDGMYDLVKQYEKDNKQHLIFRLQASNGLNYHDFELTKFKGKVCIADMFLYLTGENLSKSVGDIIQNYNNTNGTSSKQEAEVQKIRQVKNLLMEQKFTEAKSQFNSLPASLRSKKILQIMHLQICSELDSDTYMQALNKFESLYSKEPYMFLALIDSYILKKDYSKALKCIDKIDLLIDKDPFLDYYRALVYNLSQKSSDARIHLEKVYKNMPGFQGGALELMVNYLEADENEKARKIIESYKNNTTFNQEKLNAILERYPSFQY
jgi:hypothetical protein